MSARALTTVDALTQAIRRRILDGDLKPGTPLREEALSGEYDVARHSLRSALRTLQGEGIVQIEPNRGARVKSLSPEDVRGLSELRIALELEAARMALERHGGTLPASVHRAAERLASLCRRARPSWGAVAEAHEALHHEIVLDETDRTLSARQQEILQMLADGMQTDAVAERLGLSTETVRTHTKRILAKLEASTRTQAVAIGIRHGLIE